jgi:hypothetical protein
MKTYFEKKLKAHILEYGTNVEKLEHFLPTLNIYDFRVTPQQIIIQPARMAEFYIFNTQELAYTVAE